MTTKFVSDIDIDFADRDQILDLIKVTPAGIIRNDQLVKHNTGVYATQVPVDPFTGYCSLDHKVAEQRGYAKLDFLNVGVYQDVRNELHLVELMREPDWNMLYNQTVCEQLIHVNRHYATLLKMPEPVDSIPRLAMFLAVIRPGKRHLLGKSWHEVAKTVWDYPTDGSYAFKKPHAISYAQLVAVHMNLLAEKESQ